MPVQFSPFGATTPQGLLEYAKQHLRIEGESEDVLLLVYVTAAMEHVRQFTRQDWPTDSATVPPEWIAAVLLLTADLYENREAQTAVPLSENKTVARLLWPHRVF